jgi:molybdopterin-containing oxidoreductase family membrane subunit
MNKIILVTGMIVGYGYLMEHFIAWYSGNEYEGFAFYNRQRGPFAPIYWLMWFCNVMVPQIFWFKRFRTSIPVMWIAAILVNIGMWSERFTIIATSLHRDFLPSSWDNYHPTWVDFGLFVGTLGLFSTAFLLFLKFLPAIAVSEVKELNYDLQHHTPTTGGPTPEPLRAPAHGAH